MRKDDATTVEQLAKFAVVGAFAGMAVVGAVLWFDLSSIASMLDRTQDQLLANAFLVGAMLKGALLGAVIGSARLSMGRAAAIRTVSVPYSAQTATA